MSFISQAGMRAEPFRFVILSVSRLPDRAGVLLVTGYPQGRVAPGDRLRLLGAPPDTPDIEFVGVDLVGDLTGGAMTLVLKRSGADGLAAGDVLAKV